MKVAVFDVDGTLSDATHRIHHLQKQPKDWEAFFAAMEHDAPIAPMVELALCVGDRLPIVIATGRPKEYAAVTSAWLARHRIFPATMFMRETGDRRDDSIVKVEQMTAITLAGYEPAFVFEDRLRVVKAIRALGYIVLQPAEGDF